MDFGVFSGPALYYAAAGAAGYGASKLFGGSDDGGRELMTGGSLTVPGYNLDSGMSGDRFSTSLTKTGSLPQNAYDARFPTELADLDKLRGIMAPGLSKLRESRLRSIGESRDKAVGTLRQDFSDRKLLGSSFATMIEEATKQEYAKASADAEAQSFIDEFNYTMQIIEKESALIGQGLQRELQALGIAAGYGTQMASIVSNNAQFAQQMAADAASQDAQLIQGLAGMALGPAIGRAGQLGAEALLPGQTNSERMMQQFLSSRGGARPFGQPVNPYALDSNDGSGLDGFY